MDNEYLIANCDFQCTINDFPTTIDLSYDHFTREMSYGNVHFQRPEDKANELIPNGYYFNAEPFDSPSWQKLLEDPESARLIQNSMLLCAQTRLLQNPGTQNYFTSQSKAELNYLAEEDTAMFCAFPLKISGYMYTEMNNKGYDCPKENTPLDFATWNNKWYSPHCRPWYKNQKSHPNQGTLSDLY